MNGKAIRETAAGWWKRLGGYRYVLWVILAGAVFLLWPGGEKGAEDRQTAAGGESFSVAEFESRLEAVLGKIDGAGRVSVMLTVKQGMEQVLAQDSDYDGESERLETVVVSTGSGKQEAVVLSRRYPVFQGALVVCQGGDTPQVKLLITQAVASLTGLGAARISVCKGG